MRIQSLILAGLCIVAYSAAAISSEYHDDDDISFFYDNLGSAQFPVFKDQPPPGAPGPDKTIYSIISESPHFKKLTKALEFDERTKDLLDDSSAGITFFAVPDWALKRHHKPGRDDDFNALVDDDTGSYDLVAVTAALEGLGVETCSEDDDRSRRRKFLKKILHAILSYHILPEDYSKESLAANITYPTTLALPDGSLDSKPLRIRVAEGPFASHLTVNFVSTVTISQQGSNGWIHTISHPLLPPPSIFQEAFLIFEVFSTYTSAIQRVGLTEEVDLRYVRGKDDKKGSLQGAPVVTAFLPVNKAFNLLPRKLRLFLFSPFGEHILKKLLQYHTVPDLVLHSNYLYNSTSGEEITSADSFSVSDWAADLDIYGGESEAEEIAQSLRWSSPPPLEGPWHVRPRFGMACAGRVPHYPPGPPLNFPPPPPPQFPPPGRPGRPVNSPPHFPLPGRPGRRVEFPPPPPPPHLPPHGCNCVPHPPPPPEAPLPPHFEPVFSVNLTVPTLLSNHTLDLHIAKFKVQIPIPGPHRPPAHFVHRFYVNGQRVALSDVPSRNGAAHVLGRLINPHIKGKAPPHRVPEENRENSGFWFAADDEQEWDGWEEWLPKWANED